MLEIETDNGNIFYELSLLLYQAVEVPAILHISDRMSKCQFTDDVERPFSVNLAWTLK